MSVKGLILSLILGLMLESGLSQAQEALELDSITATGTRSNGCSLDWATGLSMSGCLSIQRPDPWSSEAFVPYINSAQRDRQLYLFDQTTCKPVVIANGTKRLTERDFGPEPGATGLEYDYSIERDTAATPASTMASLGLTRYYATLPGGNGVIMGSFGGVWTMNHDVRLQFSYGEPHSDNWCASLPGGPTQECPLIQNGVALTNIEVFDGAKIYEYADPTGQWSGSGTASNKIKRLTNSWEVTADSGVISIFDNAGRILSRKDRHGIGLTYTYHQPNYFRLQTVSHTGGRSISFEWTGSLLTKVTDSAGNQYNYEYHDVPNPPGTNLKLLSKVTYPAGLGNRTYHYGETPQKISLLSGLSIDGVRYSTYKWDPANRVTESGLVSGNKDTFSYGTNKTIVTGSGGIPVTYNFSGGKMTSTSRTVPDCGAATARRFYSGTDLDYELDWLGNKTDYTYTNKKLTHLVTAAGTSEARKTVNEYNADHRISKIIRYNTYDTPQSETIFTYYPASSAQRGRIQSVQNINRTNLGIQDQTRTFNYSYTFHANGMPATITQSGPESGATSVTTYSSSGDVLSYKNAAGHIVQFSNHNGLGLAQTVVDPVGLNKQLAYDAKGRISSESLIINNTPITTSYIYNGFNQPTQTTYPDGTKLYQTYNAVGLLSTQYVSPNYVERFAYNNQDKLTSHTITDAGGQTVYFREGYTYDGLGRIKTATNASGATILTYVYDANGNIKTAQDALGRVTTYEYNANGEVKKITGPGPSSYVEQFVYSALGQLDQYIDPKNNTWTLAWDGLGNQVYQNSPDTGPTHYYYDIAGNVDSINDNAGKTTVFTQDLLGRPLTQTANSQSITVAYDQCSYGKGKVCSMTDASGSTQYTYDTAGRLKTQVSKINGVNYTLTYDYDSYSRLQSLTYPGGNKITYEYNNWSQVSKVSGLIGGVQKTIATIEQQPLRPINKVTFGNGVVRQYAYDTNDRLTGISSPSIQGLGFSYNNNNHITAVTNSINAALPQQLFGYDEVGRLGSVTSSAGDQSWTFDANGNRETHTWGGAIDDYVPNTANNRIPTITGSRAKSFTFNSLGNITAKSGYGDNQSYGYDAFDRMSSVTYSGGTTYYANNGLNQRVRKSGAGPIGNVSYLHDSSGLLLGETSHNGTAITTQYIWLGGELIGVIRHNVLYYAHTDQLGRPEVITDQNQTTVWRTHLFAYQSSAYFDTFGGLHVGFPGQYYDPESDLWYNWHRYYDASTGRYLQSDPIGLGGGRNTYAYVTGNPISFIDPFGLASCPAVPAAPPGVNVNDNINIARDYSWLNPGATYAFYQLVRNKGLWDYKRRGREYEDFGNFNFGATAAAMGFPYFIAQNGAGIYQQLRGAAAAGQGKPLLRWPYGDDLKDAKQIKAGYDYTNNNCGCEQ